VTQKEETAGPRVAHQVQPREKFLKLGSQGWFSAFLALVFILVWEFGSRIKWISPLYFPPPSFILETISRLAEKQVLVGHLYSTMLRFALGFLAGGAGGLLLGFAMGWSKMFRTIVDPFLAAIHPLPKIALLPLIMVIFGIGDQSFILVIAMGAFFPLLINTLSGIRQINPHYFDIARNYGANSQQIFRRVLWPGTRPMIISGARIALNTSLLITVAVEMVGASRGLGFMIWMAWTTFRVEEIYVSLFFIVLLGILINILLNFVQRKWMPWVPADAGADH